MKTITLLAGVWLGVVVSTQAQYAVVTGAGASPVYGPAPYAVVTGAPCAGTVAPCASAVAPPVRYSVTGPGCASSCDLPPVIYHVPTRNVVYFGRPESSIRNYLNGQPHQYPPVIYFGRGEALQRGYNFNYCR